MAAERVERAQLMAGDPWRLDHPNEWYLDGGHSFIRLMRFMNLLELGKPVISWSKMMLAMAFFMTMAATWNYIFGNDPAGLEKVLVAVGTFSGTLMNYAYRRHINYLRFVKDQELDG